MLTVQSPDKTALLPKGLLADDEQVLWLDRPSLWFLILPALRDYLMPIGAAVLVIALGGIGPTTPITLAGLALVLLIRMGVQWLRWVSRVYIVTDQQAVMIVGVLTTQTLRVPLQQIQHTTVTRTFLEQLTGIGTIQAASAGTGFSEIVWNMLAEPYLVQKVLEDAKASKRG